MGLYVGQKEESGRIILTFSNKYGTFLYFTRNNSFFSLPQHIVCHGLLTVEPSHSMRHTTLGRTLLTWDHLDADASTRQNSHTSLTKQNFKPQAEFGAGISAYEGHTPTPQTARTQASAVHNKYFYNSYRDFVGDLEINVDVHGIILLQ